MKNRAFTRVFSFLLQLDVYLPFHVRKLVALPLRVDCYIGPAFCSLMGR
jgi:hypothetical protein